MFVVMCKHASREAVGICYYDSEEEARALADTLRQHARNQNRLIYYWVTSQF